MTVRRDPRTGAATLLDEAVRAFVDDLAPEVEALNPGVEDVDAARLRADVEVEAYNLTCAFIDAVGLHTDEELWALITVFGHRLPSDLGRATPAHVREAGLVVGRRAHLDRASGLTEVLAAADARDGGDRAERLARDGAEIGHAVAALDLLPARAELAAVEAFRATVRRGGPPAPGGAGARRGRAPPPPAPPR